MEKENNDISTNDQIEERLNRIKNKLNKEKEKKEENDEILEDNIEQNNNIEDIKKLKDKVKMDNAPELKEVKELDKNIQKFKSELEEANNNNIGKEKLGNIIEKTNEMIKNYEKQLQYYSMYNGKYNIKDLSVSSCTDITALNERNFSILSDKKKVFENELNKLNIEEGNPDIESVKKLYEDKIDTLFKENKNLNKVIEKMTNQVVANFQLKINDLFKENKNIKELNSELEEKVMKVKFIFAENSRFQQKMKEKELEVIEMNKQQVIYMNKFEKATQDIKKLKENIKNSRDNILDKERKFNEKCIEIKKMESVLEERDNTIKEKILKIAKQENEIKLLCTDNALWEEKYKDKVKENENFKKWAMWDTDLVESFKKIEKLTEDLNDTKKNLENAIEENDKYKDMNIKMKEELDNRKSNENKLKKENEELNVIKEKYLEIQEKLKDYLDLKKQNETYKKEIPEMKNEYETKINNDKNNFENEIQKIIKESENKLNDLKNQHSSNLNTIQENHNKKIGKLEEEIQSLKDEITSLKDEISKKDKDYEDLNTQMENKTETLRNLKQSYDNLFEKVKVTEEKIQKYEKNDKRNKSVFDQDEEDNTNNNEDKAITEKIISTFDQFSFTKEVLNDYLYCLYLFETTVSVQSLISNILGNWNIYSTYSFKNSKLNSTSNYPLNSIQNEFLEDVYFIAFDKFISKKLLFNKDEVLVNGVLDKKILKVNFENFDQGTINEICLELIKKNIMTKLKSPKTLEQLSQLFNSKYTKKFDFQGEKLSDFLSKQVMPVVQKRISRYDKNLIMEMRTLVELSLHNLKDGKIIIDGEEVYNFEKFFDQYNNYSNISERNLKIEMQNAIFNNGEAIDNIKHTMKYYCPQIIRMEKCFPKKNDDKNNKNNTTSNLGYLNKVLASINYYQPNVSQLTFTNNKLDQIFNETFLSCIKLIKNLGMLDLSNNELNEQNIKGLFEHLGQNKTLKRLYLNNNNISSACGFYMADSFKKNTSIEILHLSHNKLNESGFDAFLNILANDNTTIKELNISYNELAFADFKSLSTFLNSNPALKSLDISGNKIEPQSANIIGVTFKKLTNLEEIKLNDCSITDESIPQLFNFLNESSIHNLEINSNKFLATGPMIFLKKLNVCKNLKYISYENNAFQPYFVDMIIQALTINDSIDKINFKQNSIKEDELKKFADQKLKNVKIILSKDKVPNNASEIISGFKNIVLQ